MAQLHDSYANMETGDRCISRGVLGMMMPTEYNNGTLILQPPGYVVFHSEMIHNARIIPIEGAPHLDAGIRQWEGDPRGRWEGNTLVIESTNFRAVRNMRGPTAGTRSRQSEAQHIVERITFAGPDMLLYSVTMEDPETYTGPWTAAFPYGRIPDFPVTRSHPPASWPSAANSSICRTYRKTAGEESRRRSPVANRWMRP